jgi:uncharacterized protein (TIGR04255 family)
MRKAGYPDFKRGIQLAVSLNAVSPQKQDQQSPPLQRVEQFFFADITNSKGYVVLPNAISFHTSEYDTFDSFAGEFIAGLNIVSSAVSGLSFVERLGLRYLDAVVPPSNEKLDQYLVREVLGLPYRLEEDTFGYSFSESMLTTPDKEQVVSRTIIQNAPLGFPPDLQPIRLKIGDRFSGVIGEHAVIDTDGSFVGREPFDIEAIKRRMHALHERIDRVFHATVTDHARSTWK